VARGVGGARCVYGYPHRRARRPLFKPCDISAQAYGRRYESSGRSATLRMFCYVEVKEDQMPDGRVTVAINYVEVRNLVGRLLTLNDAANVDPVRREATKTLLKQTVYGWLDDMALDQEVEDWGPRGGLPLDLPEMGH
jgi:hypothetical protein